MTCHVRDIGEAPAVPVIWREHPFAPPKIGRAPAGATIGEIVAAYGPDLPKEFDALGVVCINSIEVPRDRWHLVRPRSDRSNVIVQIGTKLHGGGQGGQKIRQIGTIVLLLAALVVAGPVGASLFPSLGTAVGIGTLTAGQLLGAGLSVAALALGAISPPPVFNPGGSATASTPNQGSASLSGNVVQPGGSVPQVIGSGMRVYPPLISPVLIEDDGTDEYAEAVYALAGPHKIWEPWLGTTAVSDLTDVDIELIEQLPGAAPLSLVTRQGFTDQAQADLSRHRVNPDNQNQLLDQTNPSNSTPTWLTTTTRISPDEVWITLSFAEGIADWNAPGVAQMMPLRLRFRQRGTESWTNAPEFWVQSATGAAFLFTIKIFFTTAPSPLPQAPDSTGATMAWKVVPQQTASPASGGWNADSYFSAGSGSDLYSSSTFGTHNVRNIALYSDRVELYLDPATFAKDTYDIQLMQGFLVALGDLDANYQHSGLVYDFFGFNIVSGAYVLPLNRTRDNIKDKITRARTASIWNEPVVNGTDFALMAVRVKNQSLSQFSVMAAAYIPTWDGQEWGGLNISDNPADHARNVLVGPMNTRAIPYGLFDEADHIELHEHCTRYGYRVNAVLQDRNMLDVLNLIYSCGYARPRAGSNMGYGCMIDRSRKFESPVPPLLTPDKLADFSFSNPLSDLPDGYRISFSDEDNDYAESQILVLRPGAVDTGHYESIRYDGLTNETEVRRRATYDLRVLTLRMPSYGGTLGPSFLACRRGQLIPVAHDVMATQTGWARIAPQGVIRSNGTISGFFLTNSVQTSASVAWSGTDAAWSDYSSAWATPRFGLAINRLDDTVSTHEVVLDDSGDITKVIFVTPIVDPGTDVIDDGCLIATGLLLQSYKRVYLMDVTPQEGLSAQLTMIDEAQTLFNDDGSINMSVN